MLAKYFVVEVKIHALKTIYLNTTDRQLYYLLVAEEYISGFSGLKKSPHRVALVFSNS